MLTVILFLLVISILVFVHELGHFLVARAVGARVFEFGIGFPPRALKLFTRKGTVFTLNWIPFGGFVKIAGEAPEDTGAEVPSKVEGRVLPHESLANKKVYQKILVLLAGVLMNALLALVLIAIVLMIQGGGFFSSIWSAWQITGEILVSIGQGLIQFFVQIFTGTADFSQVAGPVGIANLAKDASVLGIASLLSFVAILSLNLTVLNLLPIPALDGGRIVMVVIEAILRRPISPRVVGWVNTGSFFLLIALMIAVTWSDIAKMF